MITYYCTNMEDSCNTITKTYQAFIFNLLIEPMNIHDLKLVAILQFISLLLHLQHFHKNPD